MKHIDKNNHWLRALWALLLAVAAMASALVLATPASAAITEAPEIVSAPSNPNTTQSRVTFEFAPGEGETSTADPIWFQCRQYPTANPPADPNTGWAHCGRTNAPPTSRFYDNLANGSQTWEIAAAETQNGVRGPVATYVWQQNISAPSKPPVITYQPDDPTTLMNDNPQWNAPEGEEGLAQGYQCRYNSYDPGDWGFCQVPQGNQTNTFEVRAYNQIGSGPGTDPITWTVDVPNPEPAIRLNESSTIWNGQAAFDNNVRWDNIGDFNDDGRNDFAISTTTGPGADGSIDVILATGSGAGNRTMGSQGPSEGFLIVPPGDGIVADQGYDRPFGIGDQNGDGIDDMIVEITDFFGLMPSKFAVIYGGLSVADLPTCGSSSLRCLNIADLGPDQGYILTQSSLGSFQERSSAGADFDGDGIEDIVLTDSSLGKVTIVKGGARSGTISVDSLTADQTITVSGTFNGGYVKSLGDLDKDGKEDLYFDQSPSGAGQVVYGRSFDSDDLDTGDIDPEDGFPVFIPASTGVQLSNVGDVDGDGVDELAGGVFSGVEVPDETRTVSIFQVPERGSDGYVLIGDDYEGIEYKFDRGDPNSAEIGQDAPRGVGDFNNDGIDDFLTSGRTTPVDGIDRSGSVYLLFGQQDPSEVIGLGRSLTPNVGVAMLGQEGEEAGTQYQPMGDLDGDGLADFAVYAPSASPNGLTAAGAMYFVYGKQLINQIKTGSALGVGDESAVLNAGLSTNNRNSEVWFEYGTSDEYGSSTDPQSFDGSNTGDAASAAIGGLEKNTTYHYRAVAKNALGLIRYGDDKTFTTTNVTPPDGPSPCVADPTLPGCSDYCQANPTAMGCPDYDWCAANPGKCSTNGRARLSLITVTRKIAVKRGKKGTVQVAVINTGGKAAKGVKVCVKAPKKLVKVKKCVKVGSLGSGASRTVKIKVQAKKKRGKAVLKLTAKGNNVSAKKAKAKVVVR